MAKKNEGPNKSESIRDLLTKSPEMAVKDVVGTLKKNGMSVTPNLVYFIKGKMKATTQRKKRVVRAARAATAAGNNGTVRITDPITLIREIKALAEKSGGITKLKALVEALAG